AIRLRTARRLAPELLAPAVDLLRIEIVPPRDGRRAQARALDLGQDPKLLLLRPPSPAYRPRQNLKPSHASSLASKSIAKSATKSGPTAPSQKPCVTGRLRPTSSQPLKSNRRPVTN